MNWKVWPTCATSPGVCSMYQFMPQKACSGVASAGDGVGAAAGAGPAPPPAPARALAASRTRVGSSFFKNSSFCEAMTFPEIFSLPPK